ncbi:MAG: hypothetical protein H0W30_12650 [Gemmatimonadaceae bacterium]|nr:hypothetical protein [Gemmatimonadaceae bacterium]
MRFPLLATLIVLGCVRASSSEVGGAVTPSEAPITSTEQLISAMHARYAGQWYKTLTFVQKNTQPRANGVNDTTTWLEAAVVPGSLRIDFEPRARGNGMIFRSDSQYVFQSGKVAQAVARPHPLMLLGFDVYAQPASRTMTTLGELGFDLTKMHEDTWQGRPVYVVGAAAGDARSRQFWVDREHLYFVRMLQPTQDTTRISETRFNKYQRLGGGWIAPEVEFLTDGNLTFLEEYTEIKVDVPLDSALFDPKRFGTVEHWKER